MTLLNNEFSIYHFRYIISNNVSHCFCERKFIISIFTNIGSLFGSSPLQIQSLWNQTFVSHLVVNNTVPGGIHNATGFVKFLTNPVLQNDNEIYYEINLTNIQNEISKVDLHYGNQKIDGPTIATLYQRTLSLPPDICCKSAESDQNRNKFFFNGTIAIQSLQYGPLYDAENIGELVKLFNNDSAYVEVYTFDPDSQSLFGMKNELRGQITDEK